MTDYSPYQKKIIDRYYKNFDAIKHQQLSELATELYLAEGKKKDRLWKRVEESLRKLEFPESRIAHLLPGVIPRCSWGSSLSSTRNPQESHERPDDPRAGACRTRKSALREKHAVSASVRGRVKFETAGHVVTNFSISWQSHSRHRKYARVLCLIRHRNGRPAACLSTSCSPSAACYGHGTRSISEYPICTHGLKNLQSDSCPQFGRLPGCRPGGAP